MVPPVRTSLMLLPQDRGLLIDSRMRLLFLLHSLVPDEAHRRKDRFNASELIF